LNQQENQGEDVPLEMSNVPPPATAVGARNPGKRNQNNIQNNILDYDQEKDKFYLKATKKLEGEPYDSKNLPTFLKTFGAKAKQYNWMNILTFVNPTSQQCKNLIKHMIYNCLHKSVIKEILATVFAEQERYTFTVTGDPDPLEDGPAFFKGIIDHTYMSTLANKAKAR
jgi:hypothetical protein